MDVMVTSLLARVVVEQHKHCVVCGIAVHQLAEGSRCNNCPDMRAVLHRRQDKDWDSWTAKQRKKARDNGEFYGDDRVAR